MTYPTETRRRRSHYTRALRRQKIVLFSLALGLLLLVGVYAISASWSEHSRSKEFRASMQGNDFGDLSVDGQAGTMKSLPAPAEAPATNAKGKASQKNKKHGRLVYRYSVVPGGVRTPAELAEAAAHDPDVALHYSRLNFRQAHLVRLLADRKMYVSYRKGGRILWTKKPHLIRAGETVITDGKVTARTRCGNRLAVKPKGITEAEGPSEEDLNQPVAVADMPILPPISSLQPLLAPQVVAGPTGGPVGEPIFGGPFGGGGGGGGGKCKIDPVTHHCKHHHGPPPVPEPGTLVLVGSGILALSRRYLMGIWKS